MDIPEFLEFENILILGHPVEGRLEWGRYHIETEA